MPWRRGWGGACSRGGRREKLELKGEKGKGDEGEAEGGFYRRQKQRGLMGRGAIPERVSDGPAKL